MQLIRSLTLISLVVLAQAIPLLAQSKIASTPNIYDMSLEELMGLKVEAASKSARTAANSPASTYIITAEDIRRFGYRNVGEALQYAVGFYVTSDRNYEYLGSRGISRPGDYNSRIIILLNGHRLNDPNYDYAGIGEDLHVDIEDVSRIEIVRGPASAAWGTSALLGAINLVTKEASDLNGWQVQSEIGRYQRAKEHLTYGKRFENGVELYASLTQLSSEGQKSIFFPELSSSESFGGMARDLDGEDAFRGLINFRYHDLTISYGGGERDKSSPTGAYDVVFGIPALKTADNMQWFDLRYQHAFEDQNKTKLELHAALDRSNYYGNYLYPTQEPSTYDDYRDRTGSRRYSLESSVTMEPAKNLSITFGAEYQKALDLEQAAYYLTPSFTSELDDSQNQALYSLYSEIFYGAFDWLQVVPSVRLDKYDFIDSEVSPRLALIFPLHEETRLKAIYGTAFRAPNNYERNYDSNLIHANGENLTPETITSYELVVEHEIDKRTQLALSLFDFKVKDIITQTSIDDGMFQFENFEAARNRGAELSAKSELPWNVKGFLNLSFSKAQDDATGEALSNAPRKLFQAGLSIPVLRGEKLYFSPSVRFVDDRQTLLGEEARSAWLTDANILLGELESGLSAAFGVYNLTGEHYYAPGASEHREDTIPQFGRTYRAQLTYRF